MFYIEEQISFNNKGQMDSDKIISQYNNVHSQFQLNWDKYIDYTNFLQHNTVKNHDSLFFRGEYTQHEFFNLDSGLTWTADSYKDH